MRGIAILGMVAISCAGCALETSDETTAEVAEKLGFSLWERGHVGPKLLHVRQGGTFTATISGFRLSPSGCNQIGWAGLILTKRRPTVDEITTHQIFPDGKTKVEVWRGLDDGDYDLTLDPNSQNPYCHWVGDAFAVSN
jgi:hypothetical protein